jgi:hypothetical protein
MCLRESEIQMERDKVGVKERQSHKDKVILIKRFKGRKI